MNDDAERLDRIRQGATGEFTELVRRHQARVFAVLHRYEREPHTLEDLAQETFCKAWRALDQFDGTRAPFEHWLVRIAVRVALDHLRRRRRRAAEIAPGDDALDWWHAGVAADESAAPHAREVLAWAMRDLSPAEQLVITLLEIEGHTVKEICQLTGSTSIAVRARALRARRKLRRAVERLQRQES